MSTTVMESNGVPARYITATWKCDGCKKLMHHDIEIDHYHDEVTFNFVDQEEMADDVYPDIGKVELFGTEYHLCHVCQAELEKHLAQGIELLKNLGPQK